MLFFRQEKLWKIIHLIKFLVVLYAVDRAGRKAQYKLDFTVSGGWRFILLSCHPVDPVNQPSILA